jgi:hypothetical protein
MSVGAQFPVTVAGKLFNYSHHEVKPDFYIADGLIPFPADFSEAVNPAFHRKSSVHTILAPKAYDVFEFNFTRSNNYHLANKCEFFYFIILLKCENNSDFRMLTPLGTDKLF